METPPGSTSRVLSVAEKNAERLKKLKELHLKRNEARQQNHKEVVEEDKRNNLPSNWEARKRKAEWILNDEAQRDAAAERSTASKFLRVRIEKQYIPVGETEEITYNTQFQKSIVKPQDVVEALLKYLGEDYDRIKLLNISAAEAERLERKKKKKNPDTGFADYEQATIRQYNRLVKNMKTDMESYDKQKEQLGEAFYGGPNTILHGLQKDSKEGIDRMVGDLEKQIAKKEKYSRRRMHNDDNDIDYINERNMKFNKKLERFYGEHTTEIKQNLERGTAV